MASSGVDPFRAVQEEVSRQMETIQADIAKWQKLPTKSPKYEPTRQRIVSSLSELSVPQRLFPPLRPSHDVGPRGLDSTFGS